MKGIKEPASDDLKKSYWLECEKNKEPYILIRNKGEIYYDIFYDVTNLKIDIETLSTDLKRIYIGYVDFFLIPYSDVSDYMEQTYFFRFIVLKDHLEWVSEQLHIFLLNYVK